MNDVRTLIAAVFTVVLSVAACSGGEAGTGTSRVETTATTSTSTTTTRAATTTVVATTTEATTTTLSEEVIAQREYEADVALIRELWRDYSDSWFDGVEAGFAFMEAHNHPIVGCSTDDFAQAYRWEDGDRAEVILDRTTIERDDSWTYGASDDESPEGRVYIMAVDIAYTYVGQAPQLTKAEVHAAVLDDEAYFFINCG